KILEEPTDKTVFILIAEDEKAILPTIYSRCQVLHFNRLSDEDIALGLINKERIEESKVRAIAKSAHGDYNKALQSLYQKEDEWPFDQWFVDWVRSAFRAHKEARVVTQLVSWSDTLAGIGRENQ